MNDSTYRGRRVATLDNGTLQIVVTREGGHIAAVIDKATGVNPLWSPPWPSIEPSQYDRRKHPEYGADAESKLLAGIMGHNLCLDIFGGPSEAEAAAGMTVHGEASVVPYELEVREGALVEKGVLPQAQLRFSREIKLPEGSRVAKITETVENLSAWDRPIAWTQHATLGPPFLEKGRTQFRATATKSKVMENDFTGGKGHMRIGADFEWPLVPCIDGTTEDLRVYTNRPSSGAFSTQLMDPARRDSWFLAWSPTSRLVFGYVWSRADFPWLGIWEENHCRTAPPWSGITLTRGMEFGVSPFPEGRRATIRRGSLFGVPAFKWIPARQTCTAQYKLFLTTAEAVPETPPLHQA